MTLKAARHVHPGTLIWRECIAREMAIPDDLTGVVYNQDSITSEQAVDLATLFGTSVDLWMNLQAMYDQWGPGG